MSQFVTCNGIDCSICSILESVSVIFRWLLGISAVFACFLLLIGGFIYIFNQGNKDINERARRTIGYVVTGFIIILIAFISVHTAIWTIGGANQGSWWKFECSVNTAAIAENGSSINPKLATEAQDNASLLNNISSLSELTNSDAKIAILNTTGLTPENLRQDLFDMDSGNKIKMLLEENGVTPEELAAFIKLENGYNDETTAKYNLTDLSQKIQDIVSLSKDDGDLTIVSDNKNLSGNNGTYDSQNPSVTNKLNNIVQALKQTGNSAVAYKNSRSEGTLSSCIDTGGDWKEFSNECLARSQIHGYENTKCSQVKNPTMGCQCPSGKILTGGVCVDSNATPEQINQIINSENPFSCSGKALEERTCPATRCEGTNLVVYPQSGSDQCVEGTVKVHSCGVVSSLYNSTCDQIKDIPSMADKQQIAQQNPATNDKLNDWFDRSTNNNNQGSTGKNNQSGSNTGGKSNTGNTGSGQTSSTNNTGNDQTGGKTPSSDLGPGNYNPTPSASALAECIGFKDGKIPYNGVLVTLLNKDDPTNAKHPSNNASRLFYLDRFGNLIGNGGDKNSGGLKVGPWTKGSGGSAWTPEWTIFNAQTIHKQDQWSFRSGAGYRVGPKGEGMNANGTLNPNGKPRDMSGCNMHSGNNRSHSSGCMTMGGNERKGLTDYVKKMATQSGGTVMMAVLPAENTDQNSQTIKSDYCGNMNPEAAVNKFKTLSEYRNYDPMKGY